MTHERTDIRRGAIIAITSGKGGVGKTNVTINLAASLARRGYRVGILDADFGLGNVDVMLGLTPTHHLGHLLAGEKRLDEITIEGPLGVRIVPASSGVRTMTTLGPQQWAQLVGVTQELAATLDFLFIDTAAGISDNVVELLRVADRVVVVTSFEPAAIVDAYAVIKVLTTATPHHDIGIVVSSARDNDEAGLVFRQLDLASSRFLRRGLRYYGSIVHDAAIREAILMQRPVVDHLPQARASRCFRVLASRVAGIAGGGPAPRLAHRTTVTDADRVFRCA